MKDGKKTGGLLNTRDVVKNYIFALPIGTEFTSSDIAKKYNKTPMSVGCYMKEHMGVLIKRKKKNTGCYMSYKGDVYVRI